MIHWVHEEKRQRYLRRTAEAIRGLAQNALERSNICRDLLRPMFITEKITSEVLYFNSTVRLTKPSVAQMIALSSEQLSHSVVCAISFGG